MAITGVGIQGDVGHDRHLRMHLLEPANGPGDQATFVKALGAVFRFEPVGHLGEKHHAADAEGPGPAHFLHQALQTPTLATGHGPNGLVGDPLMDKEGVDEISGSELVLAHHRA